MRYLVKAKLNPGRETALRESIRSGTLGKGSIAGDEYDWNMKNAGASDDGVVHWVETCFCATPMEEERPFWEEYFQLLSVKDAHSRKHCRDLNGTELWACGNCDCTRRLEEKLSRTGRSFLKSLDELPGAEQ
jgi:hypothetical protein